MSRSPRFDYPGCVHHVMCRGIDKGLIFRDDSDRECLQRILSAVLRSTHTSCMAWAFMPNHHHLQLRTSRHSISSVMHRVNTAYAGAFNRRHGRVGPLFQGRFRSLPIEDETYLATVTRYIHLNPLRGGTVSSIEELEQYRWSGYAALVSLRGDGILDLSSVDAGVPRHPEHRRAALREHMIQAWLGTDRPVVLLSEWKPTAGVETRHDRAAPSAPGGPSVSAVCHDASNRTRRIALLRSAGWTIDGVRNMVCRRLGVSVADVLDGCRRKSSAEARAAIAWLAREYLGESTAAIGRSTGVSRQAARRAVDRGCALAPRVDERGRLARFRP